MSVRAAVAPTVSASGAKPATSGAMARTPESQQLAGPPIAGGRRPAGRRRAWGRPWRHDPVGDGGGPEEGLEMA